MGIAQIPDSHFSTVEFCASNPHQPRASKGCLYSQGIARMHHLMNEKQSILRFSLAQGRNNLPALLCSAARLQGGVLQVKTLPYNLKKGSGKAGAASKGATAPWGKRGLMRGKNVNYCLSSITDKNDNNISWVNKGYFNLPESVLSFHKQLPLAIWYMRHLLVSAQLLTSLSFPAKLRFPTGRR